MSPAKASSAPATVHDLLAEAERIGGELHRLAHWRANRLTRPAMAAYATTMAGRSEPELRELLARVEREAPALFTLLGLVASGWRVGAQVHCPGEHGSFADFTTPERSAAYSDRTRLGLSVAEASGLAVLMLADDQDATFGDASRPGEADELAAAARTRLEELNRLVLEGLCVADLIDLRAFVRVNGRLVEYSPNLAHDVAATAPLPPVGPAIAA